jgi:hypothetical protein
VRGGTIAKLLCGAWPRLCGWGLFLSNCPSGTSATRIGWVVSTLSDTKAIEKLRKEIHFSRYAKF